MSKSLIIYNARIVTPLGHAARKGSEMSNLQVIEGGEVEVRDGIITYVGKSRGNRTSGIHDGILNYDAQGKCLLPGFVDSHTHFVFGGERAEEFSWRHR